MTRAEALRKAGTGSCILPVSGIECEYRVARTRELAYAGLIPLRMTNLDWEGMSEQEREDHLKRTVQIMERVVCECSLDPRITKKKPKTGQVSVEALVDEDLSFLYNKVMDDTVQLYMNAEPATESKAQDDSIKLIADISRAWGLNPLEVADLPPERFEELLMYTEFISKPKGE